MSSESAWARACGSRPPPIPGSSLLPPFLSPGSVRFCGETLDRERLVQATGGYWELRSGGVLDYVSCVFDRDEFEKGVAQLWGRAPTPDWFISRPRSVSPDAVSGLGAHIADLLRGLQARPHVLAERNVRRLWEASLLRLTIAAITSGSDARTRLPPISRRRRGVHRALDFVAAHPGLVPTLPDLCEVAGVSERTLEYGFREEFGVTPVRYLKLVRLNGARRDLLRGSPRTARVTDVALRWGFLEAGRFAGEYQRLFGELPSQTLAGTRGSGSGR